jgi:23S rRNA pseudouridine2605 synthase
MALIRLQKALAGAGVASRRAAERLIEQGRVEVNGKLVRELGTRVDPDRDEVRVEGRPIAKQTVFTLLLHKPRGVVCTLRDPEGRPTVAELVAKVPARVAPVGRLDYDTSGVLLLTNDGELAARLTHPRSGTPKVYQAKVKSPMGEAELRRWRERIEIAGKLTQPAEVRVVRREGDKSWLEITLREGKNRQIHRLGEHAGTPVMRLVRTSFAGLTAAGLKPGQWRYLTAVELAGLRGSAGVARSAPLPLASSSSSRPRTRT